MKKLLLLFVGILIIFTSCKKDLDFNKFKEFSLNPEFGLPLAILDLKMKDVIKQDSFFKYDPNGLIKFVYKKDSIANYPADSFVTIEKTPTQTYFTRIGTIDIGSIGINNSRTLSNLAANFSAATRNALNSAAGNVTIFPSINDNNNIMVVLPNQSNANFVDVTMASGYLKLTFANNLPVTIDVVRINLFNLVPFQTLLGQIILTNIPPGNAKSDSINLRGKTLSSSLGYTMPQFRTFASSSPVLVNLNDSISILASSNSLRAASGNAVFPSQEINPQDIIVPIKNDDSTVRVKNAIFDLADINYSIQSTVKEKIDLTIKIPGAVKNGLPLAPVVINLENSTVTGKIDLSNTNLDLSLLPGQAYNNLIVVIEPKLISSNQIKPFDSSDFIDAIFTFGDFKFKGIEGYLGKKSLSIPSNQTNFDGFSEFGSGIKLQDATLRITTNNGFGLPIFVQLNAVAENDKGIKQPLNGAGFTMAYPTLAQKGQTINGTHEYNKNNSSIVDFIGVAPSKIAFDGVVELNKNGFTGYTNFIYTDAAINVGFEMEAPFNLTADNLTLQDTINNPFIQVDETNQKFKENTFLGMDTAQFDLAEIITNINNSFPFTGGFTMYFADKDLVVKDSISAPVLFESATPDANGRTQINKVTIGGFKLTKAQFTNMLDNNLIKTFINIKLNTYQNGSVPVKLYSDYVTRVGLSAKLKIKQKVSGGSN